MKREVLFYRKSSGECPVEEFLDSLSAKTARKVVWVLTLAEDLERVPAHYFCKLADTDDIWEFRVKLGSNIFRVFAFWDDSRIILTHGFVKKTQKTPPEEIRRAENFKEDYFQRTKGK
jgi:phage-related protein